MENDITNVVIAVWGFQKNRISSFYADLEFGVSCRF